MKTIKLTQGRTALVDDEDYDRINQYNWCCSGKKGYPMSYCGGSPITLHRFIMGELSEDIDHIDGNVLNNQKTNLRECYRAQNYWNAKRSKVNTSGAKGVCWDKRQNRWYARVMKHRKQYRKTFQDFSEAVEWRKQIATILHGEFVNHG